MARTTSTDPILVIGAGPSGLVAALTIAQNGVPVRIIDKAHEFHQASRGGGLHPRTMEFYRFLGVADDVRRFGGPLPPVQMYKMPGGTEPVAKWKLYEDMKTTADRPEDTIVLSQYINEGVLRNHLSTHGVNVELGTEPVSFAQDAMGLTVALKRAGVDEPEMARFAYAIGADGAQGFTREAIGATFEGETKTPDGQTWADVEADGLSSEPVWHIWTETGKFTIMMRPKHEPGTFHLGIIGQNFDPVDLSTDPLKFTESFHKYTGRRDIVLKNFTALTYWKPKLRMANKLSEGRVFLCGDAAHIHSPAGGQGLNTSVGDSFNLAWKLALVYKGLASVDLLSTYQTERMPVIAHMLAITSNLHTRLFNSQRVNAAQTTSNAPASSAKDASGVFRWRNNALRQLEINYRWSPIVLDARGSDGRDAEELMAHAYDGYPEEPVRAGDRAPEAPGLVDAMGKETSLFELFKPDRHTLLVFSPPSLEPNIPNIVAFALRSPLAGVMQTLILHRESVPEGVGGATGYLDREGHAHKAYGIEGQAVVVCVVRPDGYIGAFVDDVEGLETYISRIVDGLAGRPS